VFAGGVIQFNIVIGTMIASLAPGAVSYLYYADRIYQLPLGMVGVAIGVVLLPDISRQLKAGREDIASHSQNRAFEFAMALTLPAAVALWVLATPIVEVLFQRGEFDGDDSRATAAALAAFAVGLPAFVLVKVFQPGFFARQDTRTPMWFAAVAVTVNIIGALLLFPFYFHVGIAIATTLSGWINALLLGLTLYRRGHFQADAALVRRLPLLAAASLLMGVAVYWLWRLLANWFVDPSLVVRLVGLGMLVGGGMALFALFCQFTGAVDVRPYFAALRRRRSG
jgi:putative peptidoglycan lipid II flippase